MKFILPINVETPTSILTYFFCRMIVDIFKFLAGQIQHIRVLKQEKSLFFRSLVFYDELKFHAQLS